MLNFIPFINKSGVLREEVFNEIFWGKLIYLEIFSQQTSLILNLDFEISDVFKVEKGLNCPDLILNVLREAKIYIIS